MKELQFCPPNDGSEQSSQSSRALSKCSELQRIYNAVERIRGLLDLIKLAIFHEHLQRMVEDATPAMHVC